jgi:hypothetical protein
MLLEGCDFNIFAYWNNNFSVKRTHLFDLLLSCFIFTFVSFSSLSHFDIQNEMNTQQRKYNKCRGFLSQLMLIYGNKLEIELSELVTEWHWKHCALRSCTLLTVEEKELGWHIGDFFNPIFTDITSQSCHHTGRCDKNPRQGEQHYKKSRCTRMEIRYFAMSSWQVI